MHLYYLGPKGTFSYLAAKQFESHEHYDFIPLSNLHEVIQSVSKDKQAVGIVPIENSIEGTINIVADSLAHHDVYAHGEIQLDIDFSLYGHHSNTLEDIHKVYSIAPAISQTINYIHSQQFDYDYVDSTIQSLNMIKDGIGAIAPLGSGETYGYHTLDQHIQDYPHNVTRFLVVKNHTHFIEHPNTTIFLITPKYDKPGLLASVLNTFSLFNINLSWIESRPLKTQLGMYHFYVQADTAINNDVNKIISILETLDFQVKIIGAFNKKN